MLRLKRKKGFTLLELIIVVIVIGILASIALPRFIRVAERARIAEAKSILDALRSSQMRYAAQWNAYDVATDAAVCKLDTPAPPAKYFTFSLQNPGAVATAAETDVIATATRNGIENPAGPFASYTVTIAIGGALTSASTAVQALL